jgi:N,N'-diacetyllegionaminate synthase
MVNPVFVIAEAGVNHNGRMELALRLCDAAQASGADAVKFQTFRAQDLVAPDAPTAQYQQRTTGSTKQYDMLRSLELDEAQHRAIKAHCDQIGIEFFSTPFSIDALALVQRVGVRRLKLSSAELTHPQLIEAAARTGLPLLMSTGMGSLEEVRQAVAWYQAARGGMEGLSLLHCTSAYPAPDAALNLLAMQTLAREFGVPTGYSDHSEGPEASLAAVALGAALIEKHITLDRAMEGPDHSASMEPAAFAQMVASIRRISAMRGDGVKTPNDAERDTARVARRSVVLARDVASGVALGPDDLAMRRPATGIAPVHALGLLGRKLHAAGRAGQVLSWDDLQA